MKTKLLLALLLLTSALGATTLRAATPEEEKAFTDKYKTAFEANDTATLESFLYTEKADPMALDFYKMMVTNGAGDKISKIELVDLTPEDKKKAEEPMDGPGGVKMKLSLKPIKKLKFSVEHKDANGSSTSSSESFVAEKDGKLVIPVPVDVK
jgi:hypothetical protein